MARRLGVRLALSVLLVSGCAGQPAQPETGAPAFNATDVMFLQMGLEQMAEGDQLAALAEQRAADPRIRDIAAELRGQWREESATMQRWLLGWQQPATPDPSAGAHAGHGALHLLRPSDMTSLRSAQDHDFDRTATSLLLGHLGNCIETSRMESASGAYPPTKALAGTQTERRRSQVQRLLRLAAG